MSPSPISVARTAPMMEARYLMRHHRIRHIPVLDDRRLAGIITDRDIQLVLPPPTRSLSLGEIMYFLSELTVGEVMTRPAIAVDPDREAEEAVQTMLKYRVGALPVVDGDRLVGILTKADLIRALAVPPNGSSRRRKRSKIKRALGRH